MTDIWSIVFVSFCFITSIASSSALIALLIVMYRTKRTKQIVVNDILTVIEGGLRRYEYDYDGFKKYYRKKLKHQLKDYVDDDLY